MIEDQIFSLFRREIIEDPYLMPLFEQGLGQIRPDKPRSPSQELLILVFPSKVGYLPFNRPILTLSSGAPWAKLLRTPPVNNNLFHPFFLKTNSFRKMFFNESDFLGIINGLSTTNDKILSFLFGH